MIVAIGYCAKDLEQAERLAAWMGELGPYNGHRLIVARDKGVEARPFAGLEFDARLELIISNDVWNKWPESCNNVFGEVARLVEYKYGEPWLWLEPDVVPLQQGWLDQVAAEYAAAGAPFLGDFVSVHTAELDVPDHMSGVGVYPGAMSKYAGKALLAHDRAWDVEAASQILPQMRRSELILHAWKHRGFEDWAGVEREIFVGKPRCVLFHADKKGTLYPLLRARLERSDGRGISAGGRQVSGMTPLPRQEAENSAPVVSFICDIFIKSYPADYDLLGYCLRSIEKFASGFRAVTIVSPDANFVTPFFCNHIPVEEQGEGYLFQQAIKISAHEYTDADYILHLDSDTVLTKPITPQTFLRDGKVLWMMTPYGMTETPWQPITEKFLGEGVAYEFMRRFPIMVPRFLHVSADVFCRVKHKMGLTEYIMSQPYRAFSEFNALGALAYSRARDEFSWIDTSKVPEAEWPELVAWQTWSREELTDKRRAEFEKILSGEEEHLQHSHEEDEPQASPSQVLDQDAVIKELRASLKKLYGTTLRALRQTKDLVEA